MLPAVITFDKLNAAGNDFICLDNSAGAYDALLADGGVAPFARHVCRRGLSVGADGLIFCSRLDGLPGAELVARFFEPDGSEAKLCGNGTACVTYWAVEVGFVPGPDVSILTLAGAAQGRAEPGDARLVRVCIPDPKGMRQDLRLAAAGRDFVVHALDTGVPHAVVYLESGLHDFDVDRYGKAIRSHPLFAPDGINANFVEVLSAGHIAVRTFEFGVEAETLACGTGSAAAAIVSALRCGWNAEYRTRVKPVTVRVRSGAELRVWFDATDPNAVGRVCLDTRVTPVYRGELTGDLREELLADIRRTEVEAR